MQILHKNIISYIAISLGHVDYLLATLMLITLANTLFSTLLSSSLSSLNSLRLLASYFYLLRCQFIESEEKRNIIARTSHHSFRRFIVQPFEFWFDAFLANTYTCLKAFKNELLSGIFCMESIRTRSVHTWTLVDLVQTVCTTKGRELARLQDYFEM